MNAISLEVAMLHLRAEEDDRTHVQVLLEAAEDAAEQYLNRKFYADAQSLASAVLRGDADRNPVVVNASIKAACLLILGNLYSNREDVVVGTTASEIPMGSRSLLTPYRVGWGV
ncbi:head-tail connector protein [Xanthomonas sp. WHRI 1810A]|uniref:head-tail connector protein n=1 Tax=Xanthomonas sp. WHRI 1810A TaxID=3161565 RepID=UPI0032E91A1C